MRRIYLDANGSCPPLPEAKDKLRGAIDLFGNPSSFHDHGRCLRGLIDEARHHVAVALNAKDKEIIFTSGASESNRLVVDALLKIKPLKLLVSPFEHPSLLKPILHAEASDFIVNFIEVDDQGALKINRNNLFNCDVLIACSAHNETGILPNLSEIYEYLRPDTLVISDIAQGFARLPAPLLRADILTFSAQKMGGIAGSGGLVLRGNAKTLPAPWLGGGQERGFRPGTESTVLITAFGEAARRIEKTRAKHDELRSLRDYLEEALAQRTEIKVLGKDVPRLCNTSAICFPLEDPDALRIGCDMAGLSVGFGAACSGLAPDGSFALKKLGLTLEEEKATIRFSLTTETTKVDIDETITRLCSQVLTAL